MNFRKTDTNKCKIKMTMVFAIWIAINAVQSKLWESDQGVPSESRFSW